MSITLKRDTVVRAKDVKGQGGFSLIEALVAIGISSFLLATWSLGVTQFTKFQTQMMAKEEALSLSKELNTIMNDPQTCTTMLRNASAYPNHVYPMVGTPSSVTLYNPFYGTGDSNVHFFKWAPVAGAEGSTQGGNYLVNGDGSTGGGSTASGSFNRFGQWQINRVEIIPRGFGSASLTNHRLIHADLVITRQRANSTETGAEQSDFLNINLVTDGGNRITECFRSGNESVGRQTLPRCRPGRILVFVRPAGAAPRWACRATFATNTSGGNDVVSSP